MITSIQNFFLKHNKWLFGSLLVVIIVTFVLTIGPQSFFGGSSSTQRQSLEYYGYDLTSESDQRAMAYTAEVSAILHPELQLRREQLMDYAYLRVAALGIAAQLGIPQPGKDELTGYIATLMIFSDPATGVFSAQNYNRMLEALKASGQFSDNAIARAIREDYVIDQVKQALGGPDYALPFENQQAYVDQKTEYAVSIAHYNYADFTPEITPTDEELKQFFNENPTRYEQPETISVEALYFDGTDYASGVTEPTEGELEVFFASNQARYQQAPTANLDGTVSTPEVTLNEVRERVLEDWKQSEGNKLAARKAEEFSLRLWQNEVALGSAEFSSMLTSYSVRSASIPAYTREEVPTVSGLSAELLASMWIYANNSKRYFSDASQTPNGAVLLVMNEVTEARMPGFEEVRNAVVTDYVAEEKRRLFSEKGSELKETISQRLQGESFEAIAESLGLSVEPLEPFNGAQVATELVQAALWEQTRPLDAGEVTPMVINANRGSFAYMANKSVPELDLESDDYKVFIESRQGIIGNAMGWSRLREITDNSLTALLGTTSIGGE